MNYLELECDRPLDVVLIGRITIDLNPVDYFKPLSECEVFKRYVGGSPANIAVGLSRLGKKCGYIGKISDDRFGEYIINFFIKEGIDISHITKCEKGEKIGLTFTEIINEDESHILMYRNGVADLQLSIEDIDEMYIKQSKVILISGTALCSSPSREAVLKAVALAKKYKTKIIFDIDYRPYNWKNKEEIALYYSMVAKESNIILGSREEFNLTEYFLDLNQTDENSADYWFLQSANIIVVKHGKEGSSCFIKDGRQFSVKPFPVKALKSFGGGDGYASSFIYGILEGWPIEQSLELGSASAALLVSSHGCSADMPTLERVIDFVNECKKTYGGMVKQESLNKEDN